MKRSSRLRPVAIRKIARMAERAKFVRRILDERPWCQMDGCTRHSGHVHEIKSRARGGDILDPANVVALCTRCHRFLHDHPEWAHGHGWLAHSWDSDPVIAALKRANPVP